MTTEPIPTYSDTLINRLIPGELPSIESIEAQYPKRELTEGAKVVRFAPSPTGYMHLGNFYTALICDRIAHTSNGIFYIRIEDTDQKRKVEGATDLILNTFEKYGIQPDEGATHGDNSTGNYGPYYQSQRSPIYRAYIKKLLAEGKAYPCFCTPEQLTDLRETQTRENIRPGCYGDFALHRYLSPEQITQRLDNNETFVIRMRSMGDPEKFIIFEDLIKGKTRFPEWDEDTVILKSDGILPTYHFAHVIDDHLMGTTHVVRGEEWLSSVPRHIQMFVAMGWKAPKYMHTSFIQKLDDNGNRRKLSKRHDPEAAMSYYDKAGYPTDAVVEYLLNIANSNFEEWRKQHPASPYTQFPFTIKKLGNTGALFDLVKLDNISKEVISRMSADELYTNALNWAQEHDQPLAKRISENTDYVKSILSIERSGKKVRKDITTYADISTEISYFFDTDFTPTKEQLIELSANPKNADKIAEAFAQSYDPADDKDVWFEKVKEIAENLGYATNLKEYKANPETFAGSVVDVATLLRLAITGRTQSPDLCAVMQTLGKERCLQRLAILKG